ncbi:MAG: DNA repair protein [Pseudomonadota bacterium]
MSSIVRLMQSIAILILAVLCAGLVGITIAAAAGYYPWLSYHITFGETANADVGMYLQIALTLFVISLLYVLPANGRIMSLEKSHRDFQISMDDVAQAYYLCHTADRSGAFTMSSEFDSVRERLLYLRDHPDLGRLEAGVMEVAAQMSQQSRHLADVYSDENVTRARNFLRQRQEEADTQLANIRDALRACDEIEKWSAEIEMEEARVEEHLEQLDDRVRTALPPLGYDIVRTRRNDRNVFSFGAVQPAE